MDKVKADIELVKAQTAQVYVQMQALDPSEVRGALAKSEEFMVEDILDNQPVEDWGLLEPGPPQAEFEGDHPVTPGAPDDTLTGLSSGLQQVSTPSQNQADEIGTPTAAATLVVKDGQLLIGTRRDGGGICGPGGHIEDGETPEQAARREALEEFGIQLGPMYFLGQLDGLPEEYGLPAVFLCTEFAGKPVCDGKEMEHPRYSPVEAITEGTAFPPFARSLQLLEAAIAGGDGQ